MWRGRDRIVVDPELEFEVEGEALADHERLIARLRARIVGSRGEEVWWFHAEADEGRSRALAREAMGFGERRGGQVKPVQFARLESSASVVASATWTSAFVEVSALLKAQPDLRFVRLIDELTAHVGRGRDLIFHVRADAFGEDTYAEFVGMLESRFENHPGGVYVYGLARSYISQLFEVGSFGALRPRRDEDDSGIEFDNRIAPEQPELQSYVAVVGRPVAPGLSLIELPWPLTQDPSAQPLAALPTETGLPPASEVLPAPGVTEPEPAVEPQPPQPGAIDSEHIVRLESELAEVIAQRNAVQEQLAKLRADVGSVEERVQQAQQAALERGEQLESAKARISELEDELDDLRDPPDVSIPGVAPGEGDASPGVNPSAREQELLWRVDELEQKLHRLKVRPVDEVEAELAAARAKIVSLERELAKGLRAGAPRDESDHWRVTESGGNE